MATWKSFVNIKKIYTDLCLVYRLDCLYTKCFYTHTIGIVPAPGFQFSSVQLLSHVQLFAIPWTTAHQASLSIPTPGIYSNSCPLSQWSHPTISSRHPLLLPLSFFPSIRVFSNESVHHIRWPKYWNFIFSISPSNEYSGLICFRMNGLYLLAVQGTLKSFLQHQQFKSINSSELSFLYSPTLTSTHDYWKNYNFDWMDLCWQSNVSAF